MIDVYTVAYIIFAMSGVGVVGLLTLEVIDNYKEKHNDKK